MGSRRNCLPNIHPGEVLRADFMQPLSLSVDWAIPLLTDSQIFSGMMMMAISTICQAVTGDAETFSIPIRLDEYSERASAPPRAVATILDRRDRSDRSYRYNYSRDFERNLNSRVSLPNH
jgi:hypothetical protein